MQLKDLLKEYRDAIETFDEKTKNRFEAGFTKGSFYGLGHRSPNDPDGRLKRKFP